MDESHRKLLSDSMKNYWSSMSEERRKEKLKNFIDARRRPELADLPPQLEQPQEYFCGYQKKFRATHPGYYAWLRQKKLGKTNLNYDEWYYSYWLQKKGRK